MKDETDVTSNHGQEKEITIVVNGRPKVVSSKELTFAQVIALAYDKPIAGQNIIYTVTFRKAHGNKEEGTMIEGDVVKIKNGTIFNVTATDKS